MVLVCVIAILVLTAKEKGFAWLIVFRLIGSCICHRLKPLAYDLSQWLTGLQNVSQWLTGLSPVSQLAKAGWRDDIIEDMS